MTSLRKALFPVLLFVLVFSETVYGTEHWVTRVLDGDSIKVNGDSSELTIRLAGIDAPEKSKKKRGPGQPEIIPNGAIGDVMTESDPLNIQSGS